MVVVKFIDRDFRPYEDIDEKVVRKFGKFV